MRSHWNISSAGLKGLTNVECNADTCAGFQPTSPEVNAGAVMLQNS